MTGNEQTHCVAVAARNMRQWIITVGAGDNKRYAESRKIDTGIPAHAAFPSNMDDYLVGCSRVGDWTEDPNMGFHAPVKCANRELPKIVVNGRSTVFYVLLDEHEVGYVAYHNHRNWHVRYTVDDDYNVLSAHATMKDAAEALIDKARHGIS